MADPHPTSTSTFAANHVSGGGTGSILDTCRHCRWPFWQHEGWECPRLPDGQLDIFPLL